MYIYNDNGNLGLCLRLDAGKKGRPTLRFIHMGEGDGAVVVGDHTFVYGTDTEAAQKVASQVFSYGLYPQFLWNSVTEEEADDTAQPAFNWYFVNAKKFIDAMTTEQKAHYLGNGVEFVISSAYWGGKECGELVGWYYDADGNYVETTGEITVILTPNSDYTSFSNSSPVTIHDTKGNAYGLTVTVAIDGDYVTTTYVEDHFTIDTSTFSSVYVTNYTHPEYPNTTGWSWTNLGEQLKCADIVLESSGCTFTTQSAVTQEIYEADLEKREDYDEELWSKICDSAKDASDAEDSYNNNCIEVNKFYSDSAATATQIYLTTEGAVDGNVYARVIGTFGEEEQQVRDFYFIPYSKMFYDESAAEEEFSNKDTIGIYTVTNTGDVGEATVTLYVSSDFYDMIATSEARQKYGISSYSISIEYATNQSSAKSYKVSASATPDSGVAEPFLLSEIAATQNDGVWEPDLETLGWKEVPYEDMMMKGHIVV